MKKRIIAVVVVIGLMFPIVYQFIMTKDWHRYEESFDMSLPSQMIELYTLKPQDQWFGDGLRYEVYEVKSYTDEFDQFDKIKSLEFEKEMLDYIEEIEAQNQESVDNDYLPRFNDEYWFKTFKKNNTELLLCYEVNSKQLKIMYSKI